MHLADHSVGGYVFVIGGMIAGFLAGNRTREYGMIGVGGMMGLAAFLVLAAWGWLVLIVVWLILIAAQWAWDALKERRRQRRSGQCDRSVDVASQHRQPRVAAVLPLSASGGPVEVEVQDTSFAGMSVVEIFVKVGDKVKVGQPLVSLESDKAATDVPSPITGAVKQLKVKIGDVISDGVPILVIENNEAD
ncbi:biotin/lipoyl-containing protein [Trinickia sp. Y13]|uniref:biotin/lipoyl-containing protein n=1 Tax=Trinickia sp. Y13 TaxID=2917807 RepID=UPI00240623C2|nr:biotin/lipoyl-containing protein [Trinickia sp. Y13]MDG0024951.1 biotin/lipoyl-binding protein [Trinickia sp. Y13]